VKPSELSLARIRALLRSESDEETLRRWSELLQSDFRAGARALGESWERRLARRRAERKRVERLFELRRRLRRGGAGTVAGVDEVGVGPLAGPVVAAAVVLPDRVDLPGLDDSKRLSRAARERLDRSIREQARCLALGQVEPGEIDRLNIYHAALEAMRRAVVALECRPEHLLVDARRIPGLDLPQTALIHGDALDGSIAAASIVAKVHRDRIMCQMDESHPGYGFGRHMGYPTAEHVAALRELGPSPLHRRSFRPVAAVLGS
jgi:ribonuclease HII